MNSKINSVNKVSIVLFFLLIFLSSTLIVLEISNKSSDEISKNKENEKIMIVSSYINMMIRQNDNGKIEIIESKNEFKDCKGIIINDFVGEKDLKVAIFFKDNTIYESIYEEDFDPELSEKIYDIDDFLVKKDGDLIEIAISSQDRTVKKYINLRVEGELWWIR